MTDKSADSTEREVVSALPSPPHDPAPPSAHPDWNPIDRQLGEAFGTARKHPRALLLAAAAVAVPASAAHWAVTEALAPRLTEAAARPDLWLGTVFAAEDVSDHMGVAMITVVNSAAVIVLGGLLAPVVTGERAAAPWPARLARLAAMALLISVAGLCACALIPRFQRPQALVWDLLGFGLPFFLAALLVVSAVEIRFAFAAPGITTKGLAGWQSFLLSRRLTRGRFVKVLGLRCLSRAALEMFGGILGLAASVRLGDPSGMRSPAQWTALIGVKWLLVTFILAMAAMLALQQFLYQENRLSTKEDTG